MKLTKILICLLVFWAGTLSASPYFSFKKYQVEDGLSHNTVWCALQDSYGFIWLGTSDGLNRYDGRGNKVYRNVLNDKFSLENNFVEALIEVDKSIWVGTNSGLYIYDRDIDRFSYFDKTTQYGVYISSEIKKIVKTENGLIWIATLGQGFFIYDPKTEVLTQNSVQTSFVWDLCQSADRKRVYISSLQEGLLCFDENGKFLRTYEISLDINASDSYKVNCIQNIDGEIWIGAGSNLLSRLDERTEAIDNYSGSAFNFGAVHCLLKYTDKELLVGTDNGLYLFDQNTNTFQRADNPADPRSLSDQTINGMMWDAEGALWVLTNLGGINYMSKQTKRFDYYSPAYLSGVPGAGEVVAPFCENKDGNIWIGTQSGLYFFNAATRELSPYAIGGTKNQKYDIRSLMLDGDYLWIGTYAGGIRVINLRTGAVKAYTHSRGIPNTICSNDVLCIYKGRKGEIYVGTSWGLCRYDAARDNFMTITSVGSMVSVVDIYEDMYNHLWIATSNSGVFSYNTMNAHWKHYQHEREDSTTITSNSVITLFEDAKGTMWFGTNGGGLCSFDAKEKRFIEFDPHNTLLPNKVIYAIEQDQGGDFWVSSNAGIFKINPVTKDHFRQFTINDGLQGNQFIARSSLKSSEGKLYFGGINGFNVFQPEQFVDNKYIPPVYVTDIRLPYQTDEQEVKKLLQLDKPLYMADKVTLSYENNSFSIRFVALSFEDPGKNRYSYILRGVDKEWILNTDNNMASYTNLPPGEYLFEVRGSNPEDVINNGGYELYPNFSELFKPTNKHSSESIWEVEYKTGQAEGLGSPFYTLFSPASYAPRNKANSNGYIPSPISNQGNGACAPTGYFMDMAKKWDSMYPDYQYEVRKFDDVIYTDTRISDGNIKLDTDGISYLPVNENKDYTQNVAYPYDPYTGTSFRTSVKGFSADDQWMCGKYMGSSEYKVNDSDDNWYILRFADVLLLLAEAEAHISDGVLSQSVLNNTINLVRERAGIVPYLASGDSNKEWVLDTPEKVYQAIYDERTLELAFEGHRWFDLVRSGKAVEVMNQHFTNFYNAYTSNSSPNVNNYYMKSEKFEIDQYCTLFPIPSQEIRSNPKLTQNYGAR